MVRLTKSKFGSELSSAMAPSSLEPASFRLFQAGGVLRNARQFRETLRGEVLRWESGSPVSRSFVQQLNSLMARHPMREKLVPGVAKPLPIVEWFELREPNDLSRASAGLAIQSALTPFTIQRKVGTAPNRTACETRWRHSRAG